MTKPEQIKKLDELLKQCTDAAYDCGEYQGSPDGYDQLLSRQVTIQQELENFCLTLIDNQKEKAP